MTHWEFTDTVHLEHEWGEQYGVACSSHGVGWASTPHWQQTTCQKCTQTVQYRHKRAAPTEGDET